jgi:hypothetical protein
VEGEDFRGVEAPDDDFRRTVRLGSEARLMSARERVEKVRRAAKSARGRAQAARKLGVGLGEVLLADRLHAIEHLRAGKEVEV